MRLAQPQDRRRRSGFTIIELLVVIIIIAILMALLTTALSRVFIYTDEVRTVSEINQLSQACDAFKLKYSVFPAGRIRLYENGGGAYPNAATDALEQYSIQYLQKAFTGIDLSVNHDWNGDGTIAPSGQFVELEGEETLIYFLRGPTGNGWNSFSATPTAASTSSRIGPFYEFEAARLRPATTISGIPATHAAYPVYVDRYGTPYAYFLARSGNQNNYPCSLFTMSNDCSTLCGPAFVPYWQAVNTSTTPAVFTFHRPDKFQILSAGRDAVNGVYAALYIQAGGTPPPSPFGFGGMYDPQQNTQTVGADRDNLSSFTEGQLAPK